jgi:hypothetical protein
LSPSQHLVEVLTIIIGECKKERVGLAFGWGAIAALRIDNSSVIIDEVRRVGFPKHPGAFLAAAARRAQEQKENEGQSS